MPRRAPASRRRRPVRRRAGPRSRRRRVGRKLNLRSRLQRVARRLKLRTRVRRAWRKLNLRSRLRRAWPSRARRRRWRQRLGRSHWTLQLSLAAAAIAVFWLGLNTVVQVARKPTELFFPVSGALHKTPSQTWRAYGPLFRRHSTARIRPELLAALAQLEGSGNPVVRTYWRWAWRLHPFDLYRPASSSVGMYQITDGTFERAKRYCIHDHVVVEEGPWFDWRSCWLNELYFRVVPSHAIELTSAFLDRMIEEILARHRIGHVTRTQTDELAALIHLCGAGAGNAHARRGLSSVSGMRCGTHDARRYVTRVLAMRDLFAELATRER